MNKLLLRFCSVICLLLIFKEGLGSQLDLLEENIVSSTERQTLKKLAIANNEFGLNLYRVMSREKKNIFFSPLCISSAFGMVFYGTKGHTADELRSVLGYDQADLPSELVHYAFNHFLTDINGTQQSKYQLSLANAIFLDAHLNVFATYKSGVQNLYHAMVREVEFRRNNVNTVNEINSWVKSKTNNKIVRAVDQLDPRTVMMLLSAVYFKGTWTTKFSKQLTSPRKFYNEGLRSKTKLVPFMHSTSTYNYAEVNDFKALRLQYTGGHISMIILLPNRMRGYRKLQNRLTHKKLSFIRQKLFRRTVEVKLPKFKFEYSRSLEPDLEELGMRRLFVSGFANFSGMTTERDLSVSSVFHKALIEVDEEGSEAAAVIGIFGTNTRTYHPNREIIPVFDADHPFLFFIVDERSDMILFSGRVTYF